MKTLYRPAIFFNSVLKLLPRLILLMTLMVSSVGALGYLLYEQYDNEITLTQQLLVSEEEKQQRLADLETNKTDVLLFVVTVSAAFIYYLIGSYLYSNMEVKKLRADCQAIAKGDFSPRTKRFNSSDELALLQEDLESVSAEFQRVMVTMSEMAAEVCNASGELSVLSKRESANSKEQTGAVSAIASAIQQTSASTEQIVEKTHSMTEVASQSNKQAEDGGVVVKNAIDAIMQVSNTVQNASEQVDRLGESSARINNVIEVIQGIAAQTNLLALNAAIEAARAGEHGRGFAVVSDEVRQLATRTHEATDEVRSMIGAVQSEIAGIVESIKNTHDLVDRGVGLANQAGDNLVDIQAGVMTTLGATQEISQVVAEQNCATQEIAASVETIRTMVAENDADIAETTATALYLEQLSTNMLQALPNVDSKES